MLDSSPRRTAQPSITHLNADTSWLLQFPYPCDSKSGRRRCNIVIDPWFRGSQVDFAPWISEQCHAVPSSVQSIPELDATLRDEEGKATVDDIRAAEAHESYIDAIVISHEFTDHCHKLTLVEADPRIPVHAPGTPAALIRSWKHFHHVHEVPVLTKNACASWTDHVSQVAPWLSLCRLTSPRDVGALHSGLLFAFDPRTDGGLGEREGLLYTPHGVEAEAIPWVTDLQPPLRFLALIHGLHEVSATSLLKINLGAGNGVRLKHDLGAKYWITTHDEVKNGKGLVGRVLYRKEWAVEDILTLQTRDTSRRTPADAGYAPSASHGSDLNVHVLGSRETLLLQ